MTDPWEETFLDIQEREESIQDSWVSDEVLVGTFHADTGEFNNLLPREIPWVARPLKKHAYTIKPYASLIDPEIFKQEGLDYFFKVPIFGQKDPLVLKLVKDTTTISKPKNVVRLQEKDGKFIPTVSADMIHQSGTIFEIQLENMSKPIFLKVPFAPMPSKNVINFELYEEKIVRQKIANPLTEKLKEDWYWGPEPHFVSADWAKIESHAYGIKLKFNILNSKHNVHIRVFNVFIINDHGESVPLDKTYFVDTEAGQKEISIWVGGAIYLQYQICCLNKCHSDTIVIKRPQGICFGVFKVPALPRFIVYEPPGTGSYQKYVRANTQKNKISHSVSDDTIRKKEISSINLSDSVDIFNKMMGIVGIKIPLLGNVLDAIGDALSELFGTTKTTVYEGTEVTNTGETLFFSLDEKEYKTDANKGPGLGDLFVICKGVRFLWSGIEREHVSICCMGWDAIFQVAAWELLEDLDHIQHNEPTKFGLSEDTIIELLKLDPFINNPSPQLDPQRFNYDDSHEVASGTYRQKHAHTIERSDQFARIDYITETIDHKAGWLAFITGDKDEHVSMKHAISSSTEKRVGTTVEAEFCLTPESENPYCVEIYYDRIFETFAFVITPLHNETKISGKVIDMQDNPVPSKLVKLLSEGRTYTTLSDIKGTFGFRSPKINMGPAILSCDNVSQKINLSAQPLTNVKIQVK